VVPNTSAPQSDGSAAASTLQPAACGHPGPVASASGESPSAAPGSSAMPSGASSATFAGAARASQKSNGASESEEEEEASRAPKVQRAGSHEISEEARQKEAELRKYLQEHRRRSESVHAPSKPQQEAGSTGEGAAAASASGGEDKGGDGGDGGDGGGARGGFDMFNDEVDEKAIPIEEAVDEAAMMDRGDNYDDKEGYFAHRVGDMLNERYKVLGSYGKGVFSTVVRCLDTKSAVTGTEVAIKVQRNNEMMRRAGEKEIAFLTLLANNDPERRKHCITYLGSFDHEDHLCMIFEAMHQNLRSALKQHGHKRGIQMDAVRIYARQMFVALRYMEKLNIMHADLKPDNIVVNDKYNLLKICDFGSASSGDDNDITPYLVSRFYRAPEIMMGLQYGCPIDMWAAAVSIFELFTGKIMFQGKSNNEMLKQIQEVKGKMPHKLIRKGVFSELHFDPDYDFLYKERDRVSGREIVRLIKFQEKPLPGKDLRSMLMPVKLPEAEARKVLQLADLLDKSLTLDPSKRLTPSQALKHPFCDTRQ
jgi:serine/threonine-protein kinase PRP4